MSEGSVAGLCRLTIRAPDKALDLAVPSDIPFSDLLPVIVSQAGDGLDEAGIEHGGWVLQRIGGEPLDGEGTPDSLELRDGEILLLRPGTEALPPVRYDNLVDAVSTTIRGLPFAWTATVSRWTLRLMMTGALLGCLAMLALPGDVASRGVLSAGAALLILAGAGAAARVLDDRPGGVLLGLVASGFLALCGVLVVGDPLSSPRTHREAGAQLLAGSAAGAIGAVLALTAVAAFAVVFTAAALLGLAGIVGGVLMLSLDTSFSNAAAGVAIAAVIFGAFVPMMSFSLSGLRLPPLPTNAEQLQEGIEPHSGDDIADRARATDHWMSGFYLAVGAICAVSMAGMARHPGAAQIVTSALLALLLVLHARNLGTSWQRLALTTPAALGLLTLVIAYATDRGQGARLPAAGVLLLVAALLAVMGWTVPGRRMLPHWGRAGDVLQSVTAVALFPTVLWTLGVYQALRAVNG
ncbi:type VII secretion integral membrane protein EccD [Streptomyces sp. NPDC006923]|uniref:type VII secretion integral membrane protein EccD n=1 Tax=Streptomyces sp. NPDC006923 TaxID=3155355 RepID=UPI0033D4EF86